MIVPAAITPVGEMGVSCLILLAKAEVGPNHRECFYYRGYKK
jgi:hypothetical protein